jgi:hypothetical protein
VNDGRGDGYQMVNVVCLCEAELLNLEFTSELYVRDVAGSHVGGLGVLNPNRTEHVLSCGF